jgi:hypothetical protein
LGRAFALLYDPFLWVGERAGLRAHRQELLSRARGCTLEIGCGTGLNLAQHVGKGSWHAMPPIVRPLIAGRAQKTGALSRSSPLGRT